MIIFGAGGIGIVALEVLRATSQKVHFCIDDQSDQESMEGVPIVRSSFLDSSTGFVRSDHDMIICVGNCDTRRRLVDQYPGPWGRAIHPSVIKSETAIVGSGSLVFHGSIIQARARVGNHVIVNTGASIDHDCVVEDFVHIAPNVTMSGLVTICEGADIGVASTIIQGITIGRGAIVGAGAVVIDDIPPMTVAVGVPARVIKSR